MCSAYPPTHPPTHPSTTQRVRHAYVFRIFVRNDVPVSVGCMVRHAVCGRVRMGQGCVRFGWAGLGLGWVGWMLLGWDGMGGEGRGGQRMGLWWDGVWWW